MTFIELVQLTSLWLDDIYNGYFTVPQVKGWVNNAQREVQKLMLNAGEGYYTVCSTASTVINQRDYAFPSDFLKVMRLERILQGSGDTAVVEMMRPITRNEQDLVNYAISGLPYNYVINQDSFSLYPVPNTVVEMRLWYAYRVEDMVNDADVPDCPRDYQEYIAILAARDGFLRDGRPLAPIESKLGYFEKMLKENAQQRNQDVPRQVVVTDIDFA